MSSSGTGPGADPRPPGDRRLAEQIAGLAADLTKSERVARLRGAAVTSASSARSAGVRAVSSGRWLVDTLISAAPLIAVRDLEELYRAFDTRDPAELSDALIRNAARTAAGIGAAAGALGSLEWAAPPALLTAPIQIAAETLAVALVEVRLIAELHAVHRVIIPGSTAEQAAAYLSMWASGRGIDMRHAGSALLRGGVPSVLGQATRRQLRDRLLARMARNTTSLAPLFTGAAIGAELNRRATRSLGTRIGSDLARPIGP